MEYATHGSTRFTATVRTWTRWKYHARYHTRGGITPDRSGASTAPFQYRYKQRYATYRSEGGKAGKRTSRVDCIAQPGTGGKSTNSFSAACCSPGGFTTRQLQAGTWRL